MLTGALKILSTLKDAGYTAYFAGGAVRDFVLGIAPKDIDIATNARPEEIERLFKNTKPVGKQFGVVLVIEKGIAFDVATFRADTNYKDGRRPEKIEFVTPEEDAKRRDFTINGLFLDIAGIEKDKIDKINSLRKLKRKLKWNIIDFVGGLEDINNKRIRFIGDAISRINEDHLRILRAVRIKNELGFEYEESTKNAVIKNIELVKKLSDERVRDEMVKGMRCENRKNFIEEFSSFGLLGIIIPEIEEMKNIEQGGLYHKEGNVFVHTIMALDAIGKKTISDISIWALLFHDIGKKETRRIIKGNPHWYNHEAVSAKRAEKIMKRLKFSNRFIGDVSFVIGNAIGYNLEKMSKGKRRELFFGRLADDIRDMIIFDQMGKIPFDRKSVRMAKKYFREACRFKKRFYKKFASYLKGAYIMQIKNIIPGPKVGEIIKKTRLAILDEKISTENEIVNYIKSIN